MLDVNKQCLDCMFTLFASIFLCEHNNNIVTALDIKYFGFYAIITSFLVLGNSLFTNYFDIYMFVIQYV